MGWLFQKQPNNTQRQYLGPAPGAAMYPPLSGTNQSGVQAPFAQNNSKGGNANGARNIGGPGTMLEQQMQDVSLPVNTMLAELYPVQPIATYKHKHRISAPPPARDYPRSYNGWTNRQAFVGPDTVGYGRRAVYAGAFSPVQLQLTPGGLIINSYQNEVKNINTTLAELYSGAIAPVSSSYSGTCQ